MIRSRCRSVGAIASIGALIACGDVTPVAGPPVDRFSSDGGADEGGPPFEVSSDAGSLGRHPSIDETTLDFGLVDCGKGAAPKSFTIRNPTGVEVRWTVALGKGSGASFTATPDRGTVAPGGQAIVTVTPKPVPSASTTAVNGLGDVLSVSLGAETLSISLKETARGAVLSWSPNPLAFGKTPTRVGAIETSFAISNAGNLPATVSLARAGSSAFVLEVPTTLRAEMGLSSAKVSFDPSALASYDATITMTVEEDDVLCAPLPPPLPVSGEGTDSVVAVSPPQVFFGVTGLVDCGSVASAKTVTLTNDGANTIGWTAELGRGAAVFTASPSSSTLAAGSSVDITVTPKPVPSTRASMTEDAYGDTLTLRTSGSVNGATTNDVVLHQSARGALVRRNALDVAFGPTPIETTASRSYMITNVGNVDITLSFEKGAAEFVHPASMILSKSSTQTVLTAFRPMDQRSYTDRVTLRQVAPAVPTCDALPGDLVLSGSGAPIEAP